MGRVPDYYHLIQAAKYLGVAPWDLLNQSAIWQDWAHVCMTAEHDGIEGRPKE